MGPTHAYPREVLRAAQHADDGAHAIVPAMAALGPQANKAVCCVQVIIHRHETISPDLPTPPAIATSLNVLLTLERWPQLAVCADQA